MRTLNLFHLIPRSNFASAKLRLEGWASGTLLVSVLAATLTAHAAAQSARAPAAEPCGETLARVVEFASDRTTLDATARALVRRQAKCLAETSGKVSVEGYWDDSATQPKARELSLRLATRVREELVKGGVEEGRVTTVGHGRERSLDPARPFERRRAVRLQTGG
jgi:outer membrane protein OmpA-like peptidoglycan-associated protein